MAKTAFNPANMLQVFRGSRQPLGVYAKHAGAGCCGTGYNVSLDRLADIVHGPNTYNHLNPTTFNEKFLVPLGPVGGSMENDKDQIVRFINDVGVGAKIGLIVIPNFAYLTDVSVRIEAEEPGLTFALQTRNNVTLPEALINVVTSTRSDGGCELTRVTETVTVADAVPGEGGGTGTPAVVNPLTAGFGALGGATYIDIFTRDGNGVFFTDADELQLVVKSMPTGNKIVGNFRIVVAANYSICDRAERE